MVDIHQQLKFCWGYWLQEANNNIDNLIHDNFIIHVFYSKSLMSANSEFLNLSKAKKVEISDCNLELCEYRFQIRYVSEQRIAFKFWNFGDLIKVDGILVDMYS